jgi:ElaB/YqjD/DUF883 family membrane-anchored ribosome-binding protein
MSDKKADPGQDGADVADEVNATLKQSNATGQEALKDTVATSADMVGRVWDYFKQSNELVQSRPVVAMSIAVGLGFMVGASIVASVLSRRE